ncbi:hypothetical protein BJV82DRAFT_652936 [Fennellomyces sp. T-0311]|nr:hypothetical protein BJV82DRAFT_652936 [Fennellomyces sp. T-0311]
MAAGDWYEYHENPVDDEGRTSDDSAYQVHQEDDIKEYELPPSANAANVNGYHDAASDGVELQDEYDGHIDAFSSASQAKKTQSSFMARLAAIPLVQDSLSSANKVMQQHALGRLAGRTLSTLVTKTQPYVTESRWYSHIERANALGNKSLDLVEEHFPMIVNTTGKDLKHAPNLMADGIRGRIGMAIGRFRAPADAASVDMSRRMALVMDNVEAVLDQYFPADQEGQKQPVEDELIDPQDGQRLDDGEGEEGPSQLLRMYRIANSLSIRIARRIATQVDRKDPAALRTWLFTQTSQLVSHLDTYKSQLPEPIQAHVLQPLIQVAQKEYEILRKEMDRTDITHVERARNMLAMSQDMVIMPLLQNSVEGMRSQVVFYRTMAQQNRAQVMNELSAKVPFLANIAPMSAFASHHYSKKSENGVEITGAPLTEEKNSMAPGAAEAC